MNTILDCWCFEMLQVHGLRFYLNFVLPYTNEYELLTQTAISLWVSSTECQNTVGYDWLNFRCCFAVLVQPNTWKQVNFLRKCVYGRFYLLIWFLSFKILCYAAWDRVIKRDSFSTTTNVFYACFHSDISLRSGDLTECFGKCLPYQEWLSCQ